LSAKAAAANITNKKEIRAAAYSTLRPPFMGFAHPHAGGRLDFIPKKAGKTAHVCKTSIWRKGKFVTGLCLCMPVVGGGRRQSSGQGKTKKKGRQQASKTSHDGGSPPRGPPLAAYSGTIFWTRARNDRQAGCQFPHYKHRRQSKKL